MCVIVVMMRERDDNEFGEHINGVDASFFFFIHSHAKHTHTRTLNCMKYSNYLSFHGTQPKPHSVDLAQK